MDPAGHVGQQLPWGNRLLAKSSPEWGELIKMWSFMLPKRSADKDQMTIPGSSSFFAQSFLHPVLKVCLVNALFFFNEEIRLNIRNFPPKICLWKPGIAQFLKLTKLQLSHCTSTLQIITFVGLEEPTEQCQVRGSGVSCWVGSFPPPRPWVFSLSEIPRLVPVRK